MSKRRIMVTKTAADYFRLMVRKLPPGWIWRMQVADSGDVYGDGNEIPLTRFGKILWACADEFVIVHARITDLFNEAEPGLASETLDEWEQDLGLPFAGYPTPVTDDERRAICKAQYDMASGLSNAYFETLALTLGVVATVTDHPTQPLTIIVSCPAEFVRATCISPCNVALVTMTDAGSQFAAFVDRYHAAGRRIVYTH